MSWKKTTAYFAWQSVRYAKSWQHFLQIWSYRKRWSDSFRAGRNSVADELPWLNFFALDYLQKHLQPHFKVFEFGGGGSTLYFCKHVAEVVTVEDHEAWFETLGRRVEAKGYQNWKGYFVKSESYTGNQPRSPQNPADFMSGSKGLENLSFEKYARAIDQYPNDYFDVILVDGRARPSCIQQAVSHLKSEGLLIVDNTERPYYLVHLKKEIAARFNVEIESAYPVAYTPDFTKTTILKKLISI